MLSLSVVAYPAGALVIYPDVPTNVPRIDSGKVEAIAVGSTYIYVGGSFTTVNTGSARVALAAFNKTTGALDTYWDPGLSSSSGSTEVTSIAVADGKVYVGGSFDAASNNTVTRNNIVVFNEADGSSAAVADPYWDPNLSNQVIADDMVYSIVVDGTRVYVGGAFGTVNGSIERKGVAAFNKADGSSAATADPWNPALSYSFLGVDSPIVYALAVSGDRVYIGGAFDKANTSVDRFYLAAFELANGSNTGVVDAVWNPELDDAVVCLAIVGDRLCAGGFFTSVLGATSTRNCLAAFNLTGSGAAVVDPWNPNPDGTVRAIAKSGTRVFLGGEFDKVLGATTTRYGLAAFNVPNGSDIASVVDWDPSKASANYVLAICPSKTAGVLVGGSFTALGTVTRYRVAGYNSTWDPAPTVYSRNPAANATVGTNLNAIDVIFSEPVFGVDSTDLVLSGAAAVGAVVGTPSLEYAITGTTPRNTWRFPVFGLAAGALTINLSPDSGDIVDEVDSTLNPSPSTWKYTVTSTNAVATVPFFDGFESGALARCWESRGTANYRNTVITTNAPHTGTSQLSMDSSTAANARNEVTLTANLAALSDVVLSFWLQRPGADADNSLVSSPFANGANFDGVAVSADGFSWSQIQPLLTANGVSSTYTQFTINLDEAVASAGLSYNSAFKIRFNHYDANSIPTGGFLIDDVSLSIVHTSPTITNVASDHANGTFPQGEVVDVSVVFSKEVTFTGSPTLELETGATNRLASLVSGNGTNTLVFRYTAQAGDSASDLDYVGNAALQLNGGTIRDLTSGTMDAVLTLPEPGAAGSLSANKDIAINTTSPSVSTLDVQSTLAMNLAYNQSMGASVLVAANYALSGAGKGSLADHPSAVESLGGNVYRLTWSSGEMVTGGDVTVAVSSVYDSIGNPIGASNSATDSGGGLGVAPEMTGVDVQTGRSVLVTFNEILGDGATDAANFVVSGSGLGTLTVQPDSVTSASQTSRLLQWNSGEMLNGGDLTVVASGVKDAIGNPVASANSATDIGGGIGVAPSISQVNVLSKNTIEVVFDEDMNTGVANADNFAISGAGAGTLTIHPVTSVVENSTHFLLTWSSGEMLNGADVTITATNVYDLAGNAIGSGNSATDSGGGIGVPPQLSGAEVKTERIVEVTFNEPIADGVLDFANYSVSGGGQGTLAEHPDSVVENTEDGAYQLVWNSGEMRNGGDVTITAVNIKDAVGNVILTPTSATAPGGGLGTAPRVESVQVQTGSAILVSFSEVIGAGYDEPGNYSISGDGVGTFAVHPDSVVLNGETGVVLQWNSGEMRLGANVEITVANIQDLAGNPIGASNNAVHENGGIGVPPVGEISLNNGDVFTRNRDVSLNFVSADGTGSDLESMRFSNDDSSWSDWTAYASHADLQLTEGEGWKTIYVQLRDAAGNVSSEPISDSIALDLTPLSVSAVGPTDIAVEAGTLFSLHVQAEGALGEVNYEWSKLDSGGVWSEITPTAKAAGPVYTVDFAMLSDSGTYRCMVSDDTEIAGPVDFTVTVTPTEGMPVVGVIGDSILLALTAIAALRRLGSLKK
jgi:hypothetical protein